MFSYFSPAERKCHAALGMQRPHAYYALDATQDAFAVSAEYAGEDLAVISLLLMYRFIEESPPDGGVLADWRSDPCGKAGIMAGGIASKVMAWDFTNRALCLV